MITEIIAIYAITDDLLKAIGHQEDRRVQLSDAEVITTALVAARFFGGNHQNAPTGQPSCCLNRTQAESDLRS